LRSAIACVVIVGAAACSSSRHGTEFVVSWNQKPTQVLMFVSTSDGSAVAIQPMGGSNLVRGTGWQLANVDPLDVAASAGSAGSAMSFFYEGSDVITKVYAVGVDANGSAAWIGSGVGPFDNPARLSEIVQYRIDLASTGSNQVTVWGQPTCLQAGSDFLVDDLANDPDCDGFRTNDPSEECVPDVYLGQRGPKIREASCTMAVPTSLATQTQACALAGPTCHDGQDRGSDCEAPTSYCTPQSACGYTFDALADVVSAGLVADAGAQPVTMLRCTFEGMIGTDQQTFVPCTGSDGDAAVVTSATFSGAMATCQAPLLESRSDGWGKSVELGFNGGSGSGSGSQTEAGVSLRVDLADPCQLTFTLEPDSGDSFLLPPHVNGEYALGALLTTGVEIPASAGSGSGTLRGVAIPLVVQL
jgi:hypothetical protein